MFKNPLWRGLESVWDNTKYVFVDEERLEEVAKEWAKGDFQVPSWDDPENPHDFLEFTGLENSINFCYRDPYNPQKGRYFFDWKGEKYEGSYGMAVALRTANERGIPIFKDDGFINCEFLQKLTKKNVRDIFCKDFEIPLLLARLYILGEIGLRLQNQCGGRFKNIFDEEQWTAFGTEERQGIISRLVCTFPTFFDAGFYNNCSPGRIIYFHKRAQLFLMIYQGRALAYPDIYEQIKDYELLGPPADYELPKLFRYLGILEYIPWLDDKINNQGIVVRDSIEEQEIRLQTVNVMVKLLDRINELWDDEINMLHLDYKVWSEGRSIKTLPHHLTPTIAY